MTHNLYDQASLMSPKVIKNKEKFLIRILLW